MTKEERQKQMDTLQSDFNNCLRSGDYLRLADVAIEWDRLAEIDARAWKESR